MHYPKPFYRRGRGAYVVQVGKTQKTLVRGPECPETEALAYKEYHRHMAALGREVPAGDPTVELAVDLFLDHAKGTVAPGTFEQYRIKLQDLIRYHGRVKVSTLRPKHVTGWIAQHQWSDATRRGAITAIKVCLAWCAREGHVAENPVREMKRPKAARRERTLTPEERARIRAAAGPELADYLDALTWAGCRPGEVRRLEARHLDFDAAYASLPGKTTAATGEPIEFPLVGPMLGLCRRLAERHPSGPIFRNTRGKPWTQNAVRCAMKRLRDAVGLEGVTAYTYRHSYATDSLERGVAIADLSTLMNHKDVRTTMGYAHLRQRRAHLHRQAEKAQGGGASTPPADGHV